MQQPGKIDDTNEIKFFVLFVLEFCRDPIAIPILNDISMNDGLVDFFAYSSALQELEATQHIVKTMYNAQEYYTITPLGIEAISFFSNRLKYHVRKAAHNAAAQALKSIRRAEQIRADWFPLQDSTYVVSLDFGNQDKKLLSLTLHTTTKEQAKQICDVFQKNAEKIVPQIANLLTQKDESSE